MEEKKKKFKVKDKGKTNKVSAKYDVDFDGEKVDSHETAESAKDHVETQMKPKDLHGRDINSVKGLKLKSRKK